MYMIIKYYAIHSTVCKTIYCFTQLLIIWKLDEYV